MRTTINLDDELLAQAKALCGVEERGALLKETLRALIERERMHTSPLCSIMAWYKRTISSSEKSPAATSKTGNKLYICSPAYLDVPPPLQKKRYFSLSVMA
ncbi:MAG: type II toxin-antitoxin system VapB family antitoxin [Acidithiobacillus ferrivorans]